MKPGTWAISTVIHAEVDANAAFTNMPAADTFLFSSHRHVQMIDLTGMSHVRLKVNKQATAGATGAKLILKYANTFSTTVGNYSDIGTSPVEVAINVTNTYLDSGWVELDPSATNGDVYLAVVGSGGDGVLDPAFGTISVAFV